jgi:predicted DNA-binding ribbon-helix-helix protein
MGGTGRLLDTKEPPAAGSRFGPDAGGKPVKRSLTIAGHRTSISLEEAFWVALRDVARAKGKLVPALIFEIDAARGRTNLSSAIRVFLLEYFRAAGGGC